MDDIDDAFEIAFRTDRQRKRNDRPGKARRRRFERVAKIGVLLVDLVDDHKPRQQKFVRVLPRLFGLDLDAVNAVNDDQRAIGDTQRGPRVRNERRITGRVDKIDLCVLVFGVGEVVVERNFSFDRIFFVIGDGRTFIDLSPAM